MTQGNGADEASVERSYESMTAMDPDTAGTILREVKQIFEQVNTPFFLRQGTCLGAVREKDFIRWDDDIDLGSIIGLHGFTEDMIEPALAAFRNRGFYAEAEPNQEYVSATLMKSFIRIDWSCYRILGDKIIHFPGVPIPVRVVTQMEEIDFAGDTFRVPSPPEDYLAAKYGPYWMTPKSTGYEKDILALISDHPYAQDQSTAEQSSEPSPIRLRILDRHDEPVRGAQIRVVRYGNFVTDEQGYVELRLPDYPWYALIITHGDHEEVLYQERLHRGSAYVYRPDPSKTTGRFMALTQE